MHMNLSRIAMPLLGLALVSSAQAATTVTGQIAANLTLTSACLVNGAGTGAGTAVDFGTLSFGTATSLFTEASGEVLGGAGGALSIQCSSGTSPTLTVRGGSHDGASAGGTRALGDSTLANFVPYDLYTDSGLTNLLAINGTINLGPSSGAAQTVNIYGKAVGKAGLPAGVYTDTVSVELTF